MTGMKAYYITRAAISAALGALFVLTGTPAWIGALVGLLSFGWFAVAPRIGRYGVRPGSGTAPFRQDERGQAIRDAAARNAFVSCMLALAAAILYFNVRAWSSVPIALLLWILVLGALVYIVSDAWMRRAQA